MLKISARQSRCITPAQSIIFNVDIVVSNKLIFLLVKAISIRKI